MFRKVAAGAAVVVLAALLPGRPAAAVDAHTPYVALGDSFASGEGATSFQADSTGPDAGSARRPAATARRPPGPAASPCG